MTVEDLVANIEKEKPEWDKICGEGGLAEQFARELKNTKSTQIRKFFNSIKTIERKFKSGTWDEDKAKAELWHTVPQAKYAEQRKLCNYEFYKFIHDSVKTVTNSTDDEFARRLNTFCKIFESVVAYAHK